MKLTLAVAYLIASACGQDCTTTCVYEGKSGKGSTTEAGCVYHEFFDADADGNKDECKYTCKKPKSVKSSKASKSTKTTKGSILGCASIACVNNVDFSQCTEEYGRVLSYFSADEESELKLFELMEGEERHRHLASHDMKKFDDFTLGRCEFPGSIYHGKIATHNDCLNPDNQLGQTNQNPFFEVDEQALEPWATPNLEGVVTLATDPGIWSFDFLSEEEADRLIELTNKYGEDLNLFGPCNRGELSPTNAHPYDSKVCFKISEEDACNGPYHVGKCNTKTQHDDTLVVGDLLSRFQAMWSESMVGVNPYIKIHRTEGNTPPMHLHTDEHTSISFIIYLSDGGASLMFPNANVTIVPKKGRAVAWLNMDKEGNRNPKADHAVQAHPASAGKRLVMLMQMGPEAIDILTN